MEGRQAPYQGDQQAWGLERLSHDPPGLMAGWLVVVGSWMEWQGCCRQTLLDLCRALQHPGQAWA